MAVSSVSAGSIKIDTRILDKMTAELRPKTSALVKKYSYLVAGSAAKRAPYKTGYLSQSIKPRMLDELTYRVEDGTEYGLRHELGFHGEDSLGRHYSYAGRPFMLPALEEYRREFTGALGELFK